MRVRENGAKEKKCFIFLSICRSLLSFTAFTLYFFFSLGGGRGKRGCREFTFAGKSIADLIATLSFYVDWALDKALSGANRDTVEFFSIIRILRLFKLTQHSSGLKILIQTFKASAQVRVRYFPFAFTFLMEVVLLTHKSGTLQQLRVLG